MIRFNFQLKELPRGRRIFNAARVFFHLNTMPRTIHRTASQPSAAPLLAVAPWIVTRGNHEECARAGQGWSRFLDVRPFAAAMSCDDPANDNSGTVSNPYASLLTGGSSASNTALIKLLE